MATSTSLLYLVPSVTVLIAYFWLGELPVVAELIGGVIVVLGVVTISRGDVILTRLKLKYQFTYHLNRPALCGATEPLEGRQFTVE